MHHVNSAPNELGHSTPQHAPIFRGLDEVSKKKTCRAGPGYEPTLTPWMSAAGIVKILTRFYDALGSGALEAGA